MALINVPDTDNFDIWRQKTNLLSIQQGDFERLIVPMTFTIAGTVSSAGVDITGVGTDFVDELCVGMIIKDPINLTERRVVEIIDATHLKTDIAFTPALTNSAIATVDLVSAINSTYSGIQNIGRDSLIRAIAMS